MSDTTLHRYISKRTFIFIVIALLTILTGSFIALANENKVTVLASHLNVRYGPGLSHEILTQVQEDDQLQILGEENQWYKVRLSNNNIGWVASWLVENEEVSVENRVMGRVTGNQVNIRQFSTTDSATIGTVHLNEEYQILYAENDWIQILFNNRVAWIHSDYIERTDTSVTTESVQDVTQRIRIGMGPTNLRESPTVDSPVVTTVNEVTEFVVNEELNDWYGIDLPDGTRAYVASWLAETVDASPADPAQVSDDASTSHYATNLAEATIVIDAGHGGHDPGAVARTGFTEAEVALNTALLLAQRLERTGANVILTRDDDTFISLNDRVYYAHRAQADAYISIHYDAMEVPNTMSGTTTYYYSETERALADSINQSLTQHGPLKNNGVRHGDFFVLRNNGQASVLLELGYLDNDHDITVVNTESYQRTIADAIYQGLTGYFSP